MCSMRSVTPTIQSTSLSHCFSVCVYSYIHVPYAMLQIWCALVQGASCRACRSSSGHTRTSWFLACTPRGSIFCGLDHAWRELVDNLQSVPDQSKCPPWCIIPLFRHTEMNETVIRTIGYSLPAALHDHVQTVAPTTYFGSPRALRQMSKLVFNAPTLPNGDLELQEVSATFAPGDPVPSNYSSINNADMPKNVV
jgi:hypothetical protein